MLSYPTVISIITLSPCTPRNFASNYMRLLKSCNNGHPLSMGYCSFYMLHTASSLNPSKNIGQHTVSFLLQRLQVCHDFLHRAQLHRLIEILGEAQFIADLRSFGVNKCTRRVGTHFGIHEGFNATFIVERKRICLL